MRRAAIERFFLGRGVLLLWVGLLGGPAAWMLHLGVSYSLVRFVCRSGFVWLLHLTTLVALGIAATAGWVAWRNWKAAGEPLETTGHGVEGRSRFMALSGLAASAFSFAVILVAEIPNLLLDPCM